MISWDPHAVYVRPLHRVQQYLLATSTSPVPIEEREKTAREAKRTGPGEENKTPLLFPLRSHLKISFLYIKERKIGITSSLSSPLSLYWDGELGAGVPGQVLRGGSVRRSGRWIAGLGCDLSLQEWIRSLTLRSLSAGFFLSSLILWIELDLS